MNMTGLQLSQVKVFFEREYRVASDTSMIGQWINYLHHYWNAGMINYKEFRSLAGMDIEKAHFTYVKYWG